MRGYSKNYLLKMTPPTRSQNNAPNTRFPGEKYGKRKKKEFHR
jgi:hypothetical protein